VNLTGTCDLSRWYVVETKAKQETRVESNLQRWGLTTFVPRLREQRRSRRRQSLAELITLLFPSYVFVRSDGATLLDWVRFARGVRRVIGFGEYATPVEDAVIAMLFGRLGDDGYVHLAAPRPGDLVRSHALARWRLRTGPAGAGSRHRPHDLDGAPSARPALERFDPAGWQRTVGGGGHVRNSTVNAGRMCAAHPSIEPEVTWSSLSLSLGTQACETRRGSRPLSVS